jgi:hypothetical protein
MAHYCFLDENNIVTHVIPGVDEWDTIEDKHPEVWYGEFVGQVCKRTSYNTHAGVSVSGNEPYRKNYAGIGYFYDEGRDAFIPPQPYPSWVLNEDTCLWDPPVPYPEGDDVYTWDEDSGSWVLVTFETE